MKAIDFKYKWEVYKFLEEGGILYTEDAQEVKISSGRVTVDDADYDFDSIACFDFYLKPKWYEDIPKHGVLVRYEGSKLIYRIDKKISDEHVQDTSRKTIIHIDFVTPLTNEEIKTFLR